MYVQRQAQMTRVQDSIGLSVLPNSSELGHHRIRTALDVAEMAETNEEIQNLAQNKDTEKKKKQPHLWSVEQLIAKLKVLQ